VGGAQAETSLDSLEMPANIDKMSREQLIELIESRHDSGIHIDFAGKAKARRLARKVRPRTLRTVRKYCAGSEDEQSENLVIEGDNLQAMATLYRDRGQVDLVLTDPPYNTGNDWRYNDKWEDDPNDPGIGEWVSEDDRGRHTKWMRFMWPRLQMMKSMLKPGGVLAICIDYRELFRLGQMLDELFGQQNRLGIINWQRTYSRTNDASHVATTTEYVLVYARDEEKARTGLLPREALDGPHANPDADPQAWTDSPATGSNAKAHKSMVYGIQSPFTGEILYPPSGSAWRLEQARNLQHLAGWGSKFKLKMLDDAERRASVTGVDVDEVPDVPAIVLDESVKSARRKALKVQTDGIWPRFFFLKKGEGRPRLKKYLTELKQGYVPTTFWASEDLETPLEIGSESWPHKVSGHSQQGVDELTAVVGGGHDFKTVKPLKLFEKIIQIWCPPDGLVLDGFAGTGTAGHAVLVLNKTTDTNRRFVLIEQGRPERGDSYARSLLADRLQRVVSGDWEKGKREPLGSGFRFAVLDKKVDAQALLNMEREELTDTIVASHFDADRRRRDALVTLPTATAYKYLVARNSDNEGFFLVWSGSNGNTDFNEDVYEACAKEAKKAGLEPRYHIYGRLYLYQTNNVVFYQIPDRILMDFGLDLRGEPYYEDEP
jgi:adenine-specific DNA-methyltransferase